MIEPFDEPEGHETHETHESHEKEYDVIKKTPPAEYRRSQNLSNQAIGQNHDIEVHQQAGSQASHAHVVQNLSVMNRCETLD